jgi:hypothetical protein
MQWVEKSFGKILEGQMTEDNIPVEAGSLEDNLPMVNYIMLHRIYDMLTLIAKGSVGADEVAKMVEYHEKGYLLGPVPAYSPDPEN